MDVILQQPGAQCALHMRLIPHLANGKAKFEINFYREAKNVLNTFKHV